MWSTSNPDWMNTSPTKKGDQGSIDELRPEYKRSDFGELARAKYASPRNER
jgi:hypothetical protein